MKNDSKKNQGDKNVMDMGEGECGGVKYGYHEGASVPANCP